MLSRLFYLICFVFSTVHCEITSFIEYEYFSSSGNSSSIQRFNQTDGIIPSTSKLTPIQRARVFILVDANGDYDACQPSIKPPNFNNGVAVIQRGGDCTFYTKIMRARQYNASGMKTNDQTLRSRLV